MGIKDLLPQLSSITQAKQLSFYTGKRVAIDVLCWLHKGSKICAREIILYNDTTKLVQYCINRLEELTTNGIIPIVVFDGADLPNKQGTNEMRKGGRQHNLLIAQQLEQEGRVLEARDCYYKAIEITHELYIPLIRRLRSLNIDYIIAPYEADAQLGFLSRNNYVDFIITEDGDSLAYGCRCVLFKLNDGTGQEVDMSRLSECTELDFCGWTHDMFLYLCILSGCDYLPRQKGIGIATAYKIVSIGKQPQKIFEQIRSKTIVTQEYEDGFIKAVYTFRHQTVFDPRRQLTVPMMPYPESFRNNTLDYLGPLLSREDAVNVAIGRIHPVTHLPFVVDDKKEMEEEMESSAIENSSHTCNEKNQYHMGNTSPVYYVQRTPSSPIIQFSSPFISTSFKALIEKPSQRGLPQEGDLRHLDDLVSNYPGIKRYRRDNSDDVNTDESPRDYWRNDGSIVIAESPPRKRVEVIRIEESPVVNHCASSFLDQFRHNMSN